MALILQFEKTGGIDNLKFTQVSPCIPEKDEVRYRVEAFALNRGDLFWLAGVYYNAPQFPARIGQEACGVVDAVGEDVTQFRVGDRVCSLVQEDGKYCVNGEFAITPARYLVRWPESWPAEKACSVWSQALTAYYPFVELARLQPGSCLLVTAGSSTAGNGAIQMGKLLGARVIATSRTTAKRDFLFAVGADAVIATDGADLGRELLKETGNRGVDVVFDTVAGSFMPRYLTGLAQGAQIYIIGALEGGLDLSGSILSLVRAGATITGFSIFNHNRMDEQLARAKTFITSAVERGQLRPVIDRVYPFAETLDAYRYLASGEQRGKIIVKL